MTLGDAADVVSVNGKHERCCTEVMFIDVYDNLETRSSFLLLLESTDSVEFSSGRVSWCTYEEDLDALLDDVKTSAVAMLLDHGAGLDIDISQKLPYALAYAVCHNNNEFFHTLLDRGAKPEAAIADYR